MYCEPCRVERLGTARFCVLCGTRLVQRPREEVEADLARVRWLLGELPEWDATNVGARPRTYLLERYRQREKILLSALLHHREHVDAGAETDRNQQADWDQRADRSQWADRNRQADQEPLRSSREQSRDDPPSAGPSLDPARDERGPLPDQQISPDERGPLPDQQISPDERVGPPHQRISPDDPVPPPHQRISPNGPVPPPDERVPPPHPASDWDHGEQVPPAAAEQSAPAALLDLQPDVPTVEDRIVAEASSWSRIWKPFFTESIGWFAGAFLILAGTFFLVSDSWSGMSSTTRALVVFGLASGWTLGFSAWAQFLWRRETTRGSARVLKLIGAAMAPLAPFAVGPVVSSSPLIAIPLVIGWCVIAAALALGVTRDLQKVGLRNVPLAMAACAGLMGLAPLITRFHGAALWLMVIPIGLLWANSRSGAGAHGTHARLFAYLAPLYLAAIFGARLHYALLGDALTWGTWAPFFALALTAALELRAPVGPDGRPHWERAADPVSVVVVGGQLGLMAWALLGAAPAFFLTSLIGAHTCWRLLKGSSSPLAPRWIYALYFFSYFAFQTCGQLVPGFLTELLKDLKARLGYAPQGTLPFAYNAVYAAVFVIAGAVLAVQWLRTHKRGWADPLLRCTWITSLLTVALAISSLETDTRPAMISVPLLLALCLGLGLWLDRPAFTRAGAAIALAFAATLGFWAGPQSAALLVALVALGLALLSVPYPAEHRLPLSLAGYGLVAFAVGLAWVLPGDAGQVVALGLAFAAAWLIGRNLDLAIAQEAAWLIPAVAVARAMVLWAPEYAPLGLAIAAVALALLARDTGRLRFAEPASALAAVVAPAWQLFAQDNPATPVLLGMVLLLCAAALAGGARRSGPAPTAGWRDVLAICFGTAALLPRVHELQLWSAWSPMSAAIAYAVLGLAASIWAAVFGRRWRPALLAALTVGCAAVVCLVAEDQHAAPEWVALISAIGVALTVRALLPSISVPIATLFALRATDGHPPAMFALGFALAVLALFEEWDFTWTHLLGKRRVGWAASLSSFGVVGLLALLAIWSGKFREPSLHDSWIAAAVLPLLWVRATRSGVLAIALAPLVFLAATFPHLASFDRPAPPWVVAGALVALTHLLERVRGLRAILFGREDADRLRGHFAPWALAGAALLGAAAVADGGSGLPWALLLLLAASELLAIRLAVAAVFAVTTDGLAPIGTAILLALAFVERLLPGSISRALGARPHPNTVPTAVLSAIGLAAFAAATAGAGSETSSAWLLGGTLAAGAVLLDQRWLFSAAVLAAALPLAASAWAPSGWAPLLPRAAWIALGAAALAAGLRRESLQEQLRAICARFHSPLAGDLASAFWLGSAGVVAVAVVLGPQRSELWLPLLAAGALLLLSPHRVEVVAAAALSAVLVFVLIPLPVAAAVLGGTGFTLCLAGALLEGRHRSALTWHHCGWALALVALGGGNSLHHPATAIAWGFAAGCAVVIAHRNPALEWARWLGLAAGVHVGLFFLGLKLSTGAPRELILPWVASASLILGAAAIRMAKASGRVRQRFNCAGALLGLGMFELAAGLALLHGGETREAIVAAVGIAIALWALTGRITEDDDSISAGFAGVLLPLGFIAVRRLAFGAGPDVVETLAALVAGAGVGSLARWLDDGGLERSAKVARSYAFWWPLVGLLAAPWDAPWTLCLLLLAQSAHFAVVARSGSARRTAATLSTAAFNGAMAFAFFASGQHSAEYLLIPFGLSLLVLLKVFEGDLADGTRVKLRAAAVTLVYSAAAFRPLTFESTNALWLCVGLCVVGVGLGIVLRVRSYVYLGTAFMITTIVANLVRYGVREPRMGALFLSGLGLAVVAFMVLVTTRRSELLERYQRARSLLQNWEG